MEFENLPPDCKQSLDKIARILKAAGTLDFVLSIAPDVIAPRTKIPNPAELTGALSILWTLGKGDWDYRHRGPKIKAVMLNPIIRNRIGLVIDLELYSHDTNPELKEHWMRMKDLFDTP